MPELLNNALAELAKNIARDLVEFSEKVTGHVIGTDDIVVPIGANGRYTAGQAIKLMNDICEAAGVTRKRLCNIMGISEVTAISWNNNPERELNTMTSRRLVKLLDEFNAKRKL